MANEKSAAASRGEAASRPRARVGKEITAVLAERILSGEWPVGKVIPKATDLSAEFGVSRGVIREATGVLAAKGLVVSRARAGTVVSPRTEWNILDPDIARWITVDTSNSAFVAALMEARWAIEPVATRLAALRATPADIAALHEAWSAMSAALPHDLEACSAADRDFHTALLVASHNVVFAQLAVLVRTALRTFLVIASREGSEPDQALDLHHAIIEAVRLRRPEAAHQAIVGILEQAEKDLIAAGAIEGPCRAHEPSPAPHPSTAPDRAESGGTG